MGRRWRREGGWDCRGGGWEVRVGRVVIGRGREGWRRGKWEGEVLVREET